MPHPGRGSQWPSSRCRNEGTSSTAVSKYFTLYFIVWCHLYFLSLRVLVPSLLFPFRFLNGGEMKPRAYEVATKRISFSIAWTIAFLVSKPPSVFYISLLNQY